MVESPSTEKCSQISVLGDGQPGIGDLVLAAELVETVNDTVCHVQKEAWARQVTGHDHGSYAIPEDLLVLKQMVRELKKTIYQQTQGLSALQSALTLKTEEYQELKEKAEDEKCQLSVELGQQNSELEAENTNLRFQKASLDNMVQNLKEQIDSSAGAVLFMSQQLKENQIPVKEAAFTMENIKEDKKWVRFYTGFDSYERFLTFLEFVTGDVELCAGKIRGHFSKGKIDVGPNMTLSHEDQLLLVLVRLRLGLLLQDLAFRFRVSESTASRIWLNWTEVMHTRLLQIPVIYSQKYIDSFQPKRVIHHQGITLTILECTDLFFDVSAKDRTKLSNTRPYRDHYIRHGYVIASPNGFMTFSSSLPFGIAGRVGEEHITSGEEEWESEQGVSTLSLPPFLQNIPVFLPPEQQDLVQQVLSVKSLVDKVLNYRFLKNVYPQSMVVQVDRVWTICCYLACMLHEPMGLQ
ncbi:uncharacterized protein LOC122809677 [Protopterus annectens]|uniref:uncharacterized protein LOC122809677 n=1 Tax=Protopterus annectens TaxID=7888 RepID=UPI001CFA9ADA|nr:uncharacterized protein LOC122809677 [Protopterus annectens]